MEPGQVCLFHFKDRINNTIATTSPALSSSNCANLSNNADDEEEITVTVVIVAVRPHAEDHRRHLYYVRCVHIDLSPELARQRKKALAPSWHGVALGAIGSGTMHRCNELRVLTSAFVSADGYHYRFDGWYEASALQPIEGEGENKDSLPFNVSVDFADAQQQQQKSIPLKSNKAKCLAPPSTINTVATQRRPVPEEWVAAMERDTAVCEVVYVCYAFQPWFPAPYTALEYLALPEEDVCHSVYLCHRCLSPFFTREQYFVHLEGSYCLMRSPPGRLLYHNEETGHKAFLIDGAKHLHYCRCLSLLGKHFIESKLLTNDVDLYEYVVVTTPRASLPFCGEEGDNTNVSSAGMTAEEFHAAAADFDTEDWDGDVVMGYFSRLKHHPDHTLSCIVTLPIFQRMRVATFLLDIAYWMTWRRQRLCGGESCCGKSGGAISRPFSPQGQSLLLSYWRRALLRALANVAPPRCTTSNPTAQSALTFTLGELQAMLPVPVHAHDLETLLLQSEFTFYSAAATGEGEEGSDGSGATSGGGVLPTSASSTRKPRREVRASSSRTLSPSSPYASPASLSGQRYTATMVLERTVLDAAQDPPARVSRGTHAVFEKRWLVKDSRGVYAYDLPQFHY